MTLSIITIAGLSPYLNSVATLACEILKSKVTAELLPIFEIIWFYLKLNKP